MYLLVSPSFFEMNQKEPWFLTVFYQAVQHNPAADSSGHYGRYPPKLSSQTHDLSETHRQSHPSAKPMFSISIFRAVFFLSLGAVIIRVLLLPSASHFRRGEPSFLDGTQLPDQTPQTLSPMTGNQPWRNWSVVDFQLSSQHHQLLPGFDAYIIGVCQTYIPRAGGVCVCFQCSSQHIPIFSESNYFHLLPR